MKICFKCKKEKDVSEFYRHSAMGDGRLGKCKECTKKDVSKNYRDNIEHYKEYERKRFGESTRRAMALVYQKRRRRKHPDKYLAHYMVSNAIRDGRLIRGNTCEKCGSEKNVQAHHHDYSKPLDVNWLCFYCHRKEHGQLDYMEHTK